MPLSKFNVICACGLLSACTSIGPIEPPASLPTDAEEIARYESALRAVLEPMWAQAVIDYARMGEQPDSQNIGLLCGSDLTIDAAKLAKIPESIRHLYKCETNFDLGVGLWIGNTYSNGEVARNICAGVEIFTLDYFDGDLGNYSEKESTRLACMDAAENLAGLYRKRDATASK